jgi:hypothetical protein
MLGLFFYAAGSFVVAMVLTFLYSMFRTVKARDEYKSWKVLAIFSFVVFAGPYGYNEYLTRRFAGDMKQAVLDGIDDAGITGQLNYFRVISAKDNTVRVIAVATEQQGWGGTERPVLAITLKKDKKGWRSDTYLVVNSISRNADSYTFPPYY